MVRCKKWKQKGRGVVIFTFEELRKRTLNLVEHNKKWVLTENDSDRFSAYYSQGKIDLQYTACNHLTRQMNTLVYRRKEIKQGELKKDLFIAVYDQEEKEVSMEIIVQQEGDHCQPEVIVRYIQEGWTFDYQTEVSWNDKMEHFMNDLIQAIQDLPEFRLLAVTGLLEETNESNV